MTLYRHLTLKGGRRSGGGGGGGQGGGGHVPPHFQKWGGATSGFFFKFSWLASLANFNKSIFSNFTNLKLKNNFSYILLYLPNNFYLYNINAIYPLVVEALVYVIRRV